MSVNSINISMGASYGAYNQRLTQETKNKLIELGIPFDNTISEQQGQNLIKNAQKSANSNNNTKKDNNQSKNDLFEQAKALAQKLGINVNKEADFNSLIKIIESIITQKLEANKNNETALKELQNLSQELASIQAEANGSSGYNNTNQVLMTSLELLGQYNKNFLKKV